MNHKDFEMLTRIIRERRPVVPMHTNPSADVAHRVLDELAADLATEFTKDNPRFRGIKFINDTRKETYMR